MDRPLDPVDRERWSQDVERVHRLQQGAPGKQQKFARALKDKMEEDHRRRGKEPEDEIILSEDEQVPGQSETEETESTVEETNMDTAEPDEDMDEHIDVEA